MCLVAAGLKAKIDLIIIGPKALLSDSFGPAVNSSVARSLDYVTAGPLFFNLF